MQHTIQALRPRARALAVVTAAVAVAVAGAVVGTSMTPASASPSPSPAAAVTAARPHHTTVLHFGVRFSPFNVIDVPPLATHEGDYKAGDYSVFSDVLLDAKGKVVGTEGGSGLITMVSATGAQIHYDMTIQLKHGQIAAQGLGTPAPDKRLAVVGGTGRYIGADGYLDLVENGDGTGTLTVTLRS